MLRALARNNPGSRASIAAVCLKNNQTEIKQANHTHSVICSLCLGSHVVGTSLGGSPCRNETIRMSQPATGGAFGDNAASTAGSAIKASDR
jgi:hypothetical protein